MTTSDREEAGGPRASQRPTGLTGFDLMRAQLDCALGPQTPGKHVLYECRNSLNVLLSLPSSVQQRSSLGIVVKMLPILRRASGFLDVMLVLSWVLEWAGTGPHLR